MSRVRLAAIAAVIGLGALGVGLGAAMRASGAHLAVSSTLDAGFDADGNIYLTFADGTRIGNASPPGTLVPAGTYTIDLNNNSLDDLGNPHSFQLTGPGVSLSAGWVVQATWTATFQASSTYVFQDADSSQKGFFGTQGSGATSTVPTVQTTSTPPSSTQSTTPKATSNNPLGGKAATTKTPFRGTLVGAVIGGKPTLTDSGKPVTTLLWGRYRVTVTDRSRNGGFTIQERGQPGTTVTAVSFVGKRSATVTLSAGQWFFYSSFVGKKTYFVVEK